MTSAVTRTVAVTLVTAPACHYCDEAEHLMDQLGAQFDVTVRTIPVDSPQGRALVQEFRPSMTPLVLLDGRFVSSGRLSRRTMAVRLTAAGAARAVGGL